MAKKSAPTEQEYTDNNNRQENKDQALILNRMMDSMEMTELIQKLINNGQGELVNALLAKEEEVYTKKGRLNKSGACRALNCKNKQLEIALNQCREILAKEYGHLSTNVKQDQ